jgi:RNA 3'-terminal phosphate cyclase (ATP)
MARACEEQLAAAGITCAIERVDDTSASHPGASLAVWTHSENGCLLGADRAGAYRRTSEVIGRSVADMLLEDLASRATVDRHAADMLVVFAALADGVSSYVAPQVTEHLETNLWLAGRFGARVHLEGAEVQIEGIGFDRSPSAQEVLP